MLKLMFCMLCAVLMGVTTLLLRQQQLTLRHEAADLHEQIEHQQSKLWNQQLQIATLTAPNAIAQTVGNQVPLEPEAALPPETADWIRLGSR